MTTSPNTSSPAIPPAAGQPQETAASALRIQTAMVLFALEQALGQFVQEIVDAASQIPEAMKAPILTRGGGAPAGASIGAVVQETYIGELIDIAIELTHQRSDQQHLKRLKALSEALGLFEIRNAVCHPNRPFHECFWHRIAAMATDPVVESLHLKQVVSALRAAQEGRITSPPDEWLRQQRWSIANNLPEAFDHEITGLIGRQKESQQLLKHLQNPRYSLVAVVGPGGCGKTALCLDVLREGCLSPDTTRWADEILFLTAKTERLTPAGIEPLRDPVVSLDQVRSELVRLLAERHDVNPAALFESVADKLSERRVLLYLDNLETLLRDHPTAFDEFVASLPPTWRVLVTSRIAVNSATVLTLGAMAIEGAKKLARDYLLRRGGERLPEDRLEALATATGMNPLAIRLALDGYVAGKDLNDALRQTRDNIIRFSYTSLLESLSPLAVEILECLFAAGDPLNRADIATLLGRSVDEAAEALAQLLRTSLLSRQPEADVERFGLSTAIRDLLLSSPQNLAVRQRVNARLREQQTAVTTLRQSDDVNLSDPLAWNHVPRASPVRIQAMAAKAFRAVRLKQSTTSLFGLVSELRLAQERDPEEPVLLRALALVLAGLLDDFSAKDALRRAANASHPDAASGLRLAELLRDDQVLDESYAISQKLLDVGWSDPTRSSVESASRLLKVHWVVGIWLGKFADALHATAGWATAGELRATLGCLRASALRRSVESERDAGVVERAFRESVKILNSLLDADGYSGSLVHESMKLIDGYAYLARGGSRLSQPGNAEVCGFADKHLVQMCLIHNGRSLAESATAELVKTLAALDCGRSGNPIKTERWSALTEHDEALASYGYVKALVYHRPRRPDGQLATYLFARDVQESTQYYVTRRVTNLDRYEFDDIQLGDVLMVIPSDEPPSGAATAIPVRDAFRVTETGAA